MARMPRHTSGGKLRIQRNIYKYRQADLAKRLGLDSTAMISRWERGEAIPSLENAFMLAKLYQVLVDDLFYDIGVACQQKLILGDTPKRNR